MAKMVLEREVDGIEEKEQGKTDISRGWNV